MLRTGRNERRHASNRRRAGGTACEFRYLSVVMVATVWKTSQLDGACVTKQDLMIVFDLPIYD